MCTISEIPHVNVVFCGTECLVNIIDGLGLVVDSCGKNLQVVLGSLVDFQ